MIRFLGSIVSLVWLWGSFFVAGQVQTNQMHTLQERFYDHMRTSDVESEKLAQLQRQVQGFDAMRLDSRLTVLETRAAVLQWLVTGLFFPVSISAVEALLRMWDKKRHQP